MSQPASGVGRIATGVKNLHMAHVLTDVMAGSTTYDTPVRMDGVTDGLDITFNDSVDTYYGDNFAAAVADSRGDGDVSLSRQFLDDVQEAFLSGSTIVNGYIEDKVDDISPDLALMYEVTMHDGASKFVQVDKVRFTPSNASLSTKTETTTFQSATYEGKAIARLSDGRRKRSRVVPKEDVAAFRTTFFANANDASPTALTLVTVPADADTGVVVSDPFTLTFSNEMQVSTVNNTTVKCIKVSDGSEVALSITADATKKIFTATHADLDAASDYLLLVNDDARDIYGQGITTIANFTTA